MISDGHARNFSVSFMAKNLAIAATAMLKAD